jgi:hypothetical protein
MHANHCLQPCALLLCVPIAVVGRRSWNIPTAPGASGVVELAHSRASSSALGCILATLACWLGVVACKARSRCLGNRCVDDGRAVGTCIVKARLCGGGCSWATARSRAYWRRVSEMQYRRVTGQRSRCSQNAAALPLRLGARCIAATPRPCCTVRGNRRSKAKRRGRLRTCRAEGAGPDYFSGNSLPTIRAGRSRTARQMLPGTALRGLPLQDPSHHPRC